MTTGTLYVVATPIGNLDDLAPRARAVLADVALICAEDTRHTGRLLAHFGIATPQFALHEHNETDAAARVVERLVGGESVALVSDAGTPLVSDPGFRLLAAAHAAGVTVSPVPGPSALVAALSVAGLPNDRFCFEGFLPAKAAARRRRLDELSAEPRTLVFFEAVHRIADTLEDLCAAFGDARPAFVGRELTKRHEQAVRGTLGSLREALARDDIPARGEFVLVVEGAAAGPREDPVSEHDRLLTALAPHLPQRQVVEIVTSLTGARRNAVYRRLLELREADEDSA